MVFAVPTAIGAKLTCPDSQVIKIDAGGSFCVTMQELLTSSQHNVKTKAIISTIGNKATMVQYRQTYYNDRVAFSHLKNTDFVTLAQELRL